MGAIEEIGFDCCAFESLQESPKPESYGLAQAVNSIADTFFGAIGSIIDWVCPVNPVTHSREFWYIPKWGENMLGNLMYPVMCYQQGGEMTHLFSRKAQEIANNLAQHSKRELDYEVKILHNNVINAWCLPGGKIAIYHLLLEKIDFYISNMDRLGLKGYTDPETGTFVSYKGLTTDDVIAALLGHEMTHADARHAARKLELSWVVQLLAFGLDSYASYSLETWEKDLDAKTQRCSASPTQLKKEREDLEQWKKIHELAFGWISKLAMNLYFLFGSRSHELEADKYGTTLAVEAGYNPVGALFLQEILHKESRGSVYDFLPKIFQDIHGLFSTHPACEDRQHEIYPIVRDWQQIRLSA